MKLSNILFTIGIFFIAISTFMFYERTSPKRLAFAEVNTTQKNQSAKIQPTFIRIESQGILLPIFPATIVDNKWEATKEGISYLTSTSLPGSKGNSVLYGHNWPNLLGRLTKTAPGDIITIYFSDNSKSTFEIEQTMEVTPSDVSILSPSKDSRITVYTCSGFLDSKRFVVVAKKNLLRPS